ncbi:MAG: fumarylacetoacetate hydrolase family protein, partial [Devosia sp.]|nr:fumarylacetoacetate hydrolase family protein [Devosia sp.]
DPAPVVGYKLGYTSAAMRAQMNITEPNYGVLTPTHAVPDPRSRVRAAELIHPLAEPEIALRLGRDIRGPDVTRAELVAAIDAVFPAIEIVDTRYHAYKFTAIDNIADNSSSARFILGPAQGIGFISALPECPVALRIDGQEVDHGFGRAAMDDPVLALLWLVNALGAKGVGLDTGAIIMTGGLTRAHRIAAGNVVEADFAGLGVARLELVENKSSPSMESRVRSLTSPPT